MSWQGDIGKRLCHDLSASVEASEPTFDVTSDQLEHIPGEVLRYLPTWRKKYPGDLGMIGKRIDGVARQAKIRQNRGIQEVSKVVDAFQEAQIEVGVCKGVSVMSLCGWNPGERICQDTDLLVHPSKALQAFEIIRSFGWSERMAAAEVRLKIAHQVDWTHPFGGRLNLQWGLLEEAPDADLVKQALSRMVTLQAGWEALGQGLHPEDQLFQSLVYGRDAWKGGCLKPWVDVPRMMSSYGGEDEVLNRLRAYDLERFTEGVFSKEPGAWAAWANRRELLHRHFGMIPVYHSWFSEHRKHSRLDLPNFGSWLAQYLGGAGWRDLPGLMFSGVRKRISH